MSSTLRTLSVGKMGRGLGEHCSLDSFFSRARSLRVMGWNPWFSTQISKVLIGMDVVDRLASMAETITSSPLKRLVLT